MSDRAQGFSEWLSLNTLAEVSRSWQRGNPSASRQALSAWCRKTGCPGETQVLLFQIKSMELQQYPSGRSGMLWYGACSLTDLVSVVGIAWPMDGRIRWMWHSEPEKKANQLLQRFRVRFGGLPSMNSV